jgi:molybdenum-dependent DNA-binding transcriptional regulator ModE
MRPLSTHPLLSVYDSDDRKRRFHMILQQINYFITVAESGSISEAAKRLFTAQSSISSAVKEIENTYGITAFIRESTGVHLTRSGEIPGARPPVLTEDQ